MPVAFFSITRMRTLPSSSSSVCPGSTASKICGCGRNDALRPAGALGLVEAEGGALGQGDAAAGDLADAELRALQVAQDADRPAEVGLRRAHGRVHLLHQVEGGVAHVDAEHVDARLEQALDHLGGVRRRSERGDDLDAPGASHLGLAPPSLGSVRRMVQSLASCVSTSKKPVPL